MILCIIAFLGVAEGVLSYFLTSVGSSTYFKDELKQYKAEGLEADILFLGSSRVFEGFVPQVFEEELGMGLVLNGGSATQRPESSYYLLKDIYRQVKPKVVILGVQWNGILDESTDSQRMESALTAYDRMSFIGRLEYLPNYILSDQLPNFSTIYRCRKDFRFDVMRQNYEKRRKYEKEGRTPNTSANTYYYGKGFLYSNTNCEYGNIPIMDEGQDSFSADTVTLDKIKYLDKICDFCERNHIKLILVASPISMMNMYHVQGYQDAVDFYKTYAKEWGIYFDNLNYLKDRELWLGDDMMSDYVHLSGAAAMEVSRRYAQIVKKHLEGEDVSEYFYEDLDALKADVNRVVAVKATFGKYEGNESLLHVSINALANDPAAVIYTVEASYDGGETWEELTDICGLKEFDLDLTEAGEGLKLKISAGLGGDDVPAWQIYDL